MGVPLQDSERSEPGAAQYSKGVSGYPTILLAKQGGGGGSVKFDGERTPDALYAFLRANVKPVERFDGDFSAMGQSVSVATAGHDKVAQHTRKTAGNAGAKLGSSS